MTKTKINSTATAFNKFGNAIERNSVNGMSNTFRNQGKRAVTDPKLTVADFDNGNIADKLGKTVRFSNKIGRWNEKTVATNQFTAQATRSQYAGFQDANELNNQLPMSFLPNTEPYERKVNENLVGNSYNNSSGFAMNIENLTNLSTPTLNKEWQKSAGILNSNLQTNPFPITINENVKDNLKQSLLRKKF